MAKKLDFNARTAGVDGRYSETFTPRANFCVYLDGGRSGQPIVPIALQTYKVEMRPVGEGAWLDANGTDTDFGGASLKRLALVNHFDGFEYRIDRGGSTAETATDIAFYIGQSVILDTYFAADNQIGG